MTKKYLIELQNKSILVVSPRNVPRAEAFFRGCRLQIVTGSRFLRVFVVKKDVQELCMGGKVKGWRDLFATLDGVACQHPQTAYVGL